MNDLPLNQALEIAGLTSLIKTASADLEHYAFDSRDATIISYVRAHVKEAGASAKEMCTAHARFWGVEDQCREAVAKIAAFAPPELKDQDFALVAEYEGRPVRKYAAYDPDSVHKAGMAFTSHRHQYHPLAWRKAAAVRLIKRAEDHGVIFPDYVQSYLHKAAGFGYPTQESVERALTQRILNTKHAALAESLSALMEHLIDQPDLRYDQEFVKQAMEAMDQYDAETGLNRQYGMEIDLPEEMIANTTDQLEKLAGISKLAVTLVNGRTLDVQSLTKEALEAVDPGLAKLGQDELAEVLPTLPKPDADLLVRVA